MNKSAFFFIGDTLLLPADSSDFQVKGLPLELAKDFKNPDIFKIPALEPGFPEIYAVSVLQGTELPKNWKGFPVRQIFAMLSACTAGGELDTVIRACHIAQWRQESRFCGSCGSKNEDVFEAPYRFCRNCGRTEFPRICPAIIVIITDNEDRILLAHNKKFKNRIYSHISGFNEAGETLEETVVREVREEVNIEVKDIVYIKSQPWPFPNSLMIGFKARYSSGTLKPDGVEIEDAKWFTRDNLPELPGEGSLSRCFIKLWLDKNLP